MKKYLEIPCPRCNNKTLNQPEARGTRKTKTCLCDTCKKRAGYKIIDHVDGSKSYVVYLIGGMAREKKILRPHRLPARHAKLTTQDVVFALDKVYGVG